MKRRFTLPLALIRPEPGWGSTAAKARAMGLTVIGEPLFKTRGEAWDLPLPGTFDAVLIGSANALRYGGSQLSVLAGTPAYAVGEATAAAARAAGMNVVAVGSDNLQSLAPRIAPGHRRLLRLTGRSRSQFDPPAGVDVTDRVLYSLSGQPMSVQFAAALRSPAIIALHSPQAARHFVAECERLDIAPIPHGIAALSANVARSAGFGWQAIRAAPEPTDSALLALAAEMCQTDPFIPDDLI